MNQSIPEEDQARIDQFLLDQQAKPKPLPKPEESYRPDRTPRKVRELLDLAEKKGLQIREGKGSHRVIVNPLTKKCMPIPVHDEGDELGIGLASKIYKFISGKK